LGARSHIPLDKARPGTGDLKRKTVRGRRRGARSGTKVTTEDG